MFLACAWDTLLGYLTTLYPTKVRDTCAVYYIFLSFLTNFVSQFFYIYLAGISYILPYYVSAVFCLITSIIVLCLKHEAVGKALDREIIE
jgi:peptidoglycan/LPS O-acetylase OafA/YrhL